jgi:phage repressor protein C with HTH and peptisase S24 domain
MNKYQRLLKNLEENKKGTMKVFGNSMLPKIKSGAKLTFEPCDEYEEGDIVFCKIKGRYIDAHLITKKSNDGRFMISNNHGWDNGWTRQIYGKVTKIENPK